MALTREQFDKLRASGLTTEQIINFERGYVPPKKEESFLVGLGRGIASPFVRGAELVSSAASLTGSSAKAIYQSKTGQQEQAKQTMSEALKKAQDRTTTKVNVFGREEAPITNTRQAVGAGLEVGSSFIGGVGAKNVFQSGLKAGFKTLTKEGAKTGLASGLTYGLGTGLQGEGNFGQVAKETALGGITGLVGGAVLAPAIGAGEKGLFKLTDYGIKSVKNVAGAVNKKIKGVVTADDIERELLNIETGYQKTRKMMNFSKDAGSETRKRLISADVLSDVTDDAGIMRTKIPGGAKDQYKAKTIDGSEGLVKETLVKEGKSVSPEALRGKMINDIMNSGLEGRALKTALNNIDGEIEGLMVRATPDGQIPLSVIHDAKISTTNSIDFNTEAFVKAERKANAGSYKRIIEETSDEPIEAINKELQKDYKVLELLDVLDGKRVKGGKLGKYFSQIGGNIVGGAFGSVGGPFGSAVGTILGGEVAGKIKGQMLKNTFGKSIGSTIEKSGILVEASNKVKAPRLLLPAPKPGSPRSSMGSGPTINLPSKTQSTLDKNYSYNLGKRNTMYNTPKTTTNTNIKLKPNNNTPSLTNKKTSVKLKSAEDVSPKAKGEILKTTPLKSLDDSLIKEAKKYKSAEEFIKAQPKIYHATDTKFDKFDPGRAFRQSMGEDDYGVWFSSNKKAIDNPDYPTIMERKLKVEPNLISEKRANSLMDTDEFLNSNKELHELLIEKGYDGINYGNDTILLFDPEKITYSPKELTDIWNKAHGKTKLKSNPLIKEAKKYKSADEFIQTKIAKETDFADYHQAPRMDKTPVAKRMEDGGDFSLREVANGKTTAPSDFFDEKVGARYYMYDNLEGRQSFTAINNIIRAEKNGIKDRTITAYRSVPKDVKVDKLQDGDWISFSKEYAEQHGMRRFDGKYKLIKQEVSPDDVWWDANDINEWGYDTGKGSIRKTVEERKRELTDIWNKAHGKTKLK